MNSPAKTFRVEPGSDAESLLKAADDAPVEIEAGRSRYLLTRLQDAPEDECDPVEPDSILNLIGIWASDEPTDIANRKREYLAEAIEHKPIT
jgi:hypothetical protein